MLDGSIQLIAPDVPIRDVPIPLEQKRRTLKTPLSYISAVQSERSKINQSNRAKMTQPNHVAPRIDQLARAKSLPQIATSPKRQSETPDFDQSERRMRKSSSTSSGYGSRASSVLSVDMEEERAKIVQDLLDREIRKFLTFMVFRIF